MADIPQFKSQETFQPSTQPLPFGQTMQQVGNASNLLSTFGSEIALRSAMARAEQQGLALGKNPKGDLIPAFTKVDEAFQNAYRNQAAATLSLQADQLLTAGLNTLSELPQLNPEAIDAFERNTLQGLDAILQQAPSQDRSSLETQFLTQFISAKGKLDAKMIAQQKQHEQDTFALNNQLQSETLFNAAVDGDFATADTLFQQLKQRTQAMVQSGFLTPLDGENQIKSARINLLVGEQFAKALEAEQHGTLDVFLSDYANRKPDTMDNSEWVTVGQKLLQLVNQREHLQAREQNELALEGVLKINQQSVTADDITRFSQLMNPKEFKKFLIRLQGNQAQQQQIANTRRLMAEGWQDVGVMSRATSAQINAGYHDQWQATVEQNPELDPWIAKTAVAANAVVPIPDFLSELSARLQSANPELMHAGHDAVTSLLASNPGNLSGLSKQTLSAYDTFHQALGSGFNAQQARELVDKQVLNVDSTELALRKERWQLFNNATFGHTPKTLRKGAMTISGLTDREFERISDPTGFALLVQNLLKTHYQMTGDEQIAIQGVQRELKASYGLTQINNTQTNQVAEFTYRPLEKVLGITEEQLPLVHQQVAEQITPLIEAFNESQQNQPGGFTYRWLIPPNLDEATYQQAQATLERLAVKVGDESPGFIFGVTTLAKNSVDKQEVQHALNIIQAYENQGRPMLQRVYNDTQETETFYLGLYALADGATYGGLPGYHIRLLNQAGGIEPFTGVDGFSRNGVVRDSALYIPDVADLNNRWFHQLTLQAQGSPQSVEAFQAQINERIQKAKSVLEARQKDAGLEVNDD